MKLYEIVPGRVFMRGETVLLPLPKKLGVVVARDVRYVVNMVDEADQELAAHVSYFHRPIPDGQRLDGAAVLALADDVARRIVEEGGAVLVHCRRGRNRSALVAALIARRLEGISGAEARRRVQRIRPNSLANPVFAEFLDRLPVP